MRVAVKIDEEVKSTLKDAATKLTEPKKRAFMAKATEDYLYEKKITVPKDELEV